MLVLVVLTTRLTKYLLFVLQCLKMLRTPEFMPFAVFIAAPPLDQLRYMHEWGRQNQLFGSRTYTVNIS